MLIKIDTKFVLIRKNIFNILNVSILNDSTFFYQKFVSLANTHQNLLAVNFFYPVMFVSSQIK